MNIKIWRSIRGLERMMVVLERFLKKVETSVRRLVVQKTLDSRVGWSWTRAGGNAETGGD